MDFNQIHWMAAASNSVEHLKYAITMSKTAIKTEEATIATYEQQIKELNSKLDKHTYIEENMDKMQADILMFTQLVQKYNDELHTTYLSIASAYDCEFIFTQLKSTLILKQEPIHMKAAHMKAVEHDEKEISEIRYRLLQWNRKLKQLEDDLSNT